MPSNKKYLTYLFGKVAQYAGVGAVVGAGLAIGINLLDSLPTEDSGQNRVPYQNAMGLFAAFGAAVGSAKGGKDITADIAKNWDQDFAKKNSSGSCNDNSTPQLEH